MKAAGAPPSRVMTAPPGPDPGPHKDPKAAPKLEPDPEPVVAISSTVYDVFAFIGGGAHEVEGRSRLLNDPVLQTFV